MQTLKTPIFDNLFLDTYYFYVPNRIVWEHWANFLGESADSAWMPQNEYTIPQITSPEGGWDVGTIADYLGIPPEVDNLSVNALPFRAVARCVQEWFRDENLQDPLVINTGDSDVSGSNGSSFVTDVALGGKPFICAKVHDYFTSCLPAPQRGPSVEIPIASGANIPVFTTGFPNAHFNYAPTEAGLAAYDVAVKKSYPLLLESAYTYKPTGTNIAWPKVISGTDGYQGENFQITNTGSGDSYKSYYLGYNVDSNDVRHSNLNTSLNNWKNGNKYSLEAMTPVNLVADGNAIAAFTSINDLRQAFQIQRFFEKSARGGNRYRELIASMFNVSIGDVRAMIPEYLGGNRLPLHVRQITQTSSNVEGQPLGDVAGMSVTNDSHFDFIKSFTEHGYIIGFMVARYRHSYQQGIERTFSRRTKFDYYFPVFAHLGEMSVKNRELFAQGWDSTPDEHGDVAPDVDSEVFGYQEAWADYRYKPDRISSMMRSVSASGLDTWHFADDYESLPTLSSGWIQEDKSNVDRTLTVSSEVSNQIFADILVTNHTTRPMPLYSIPGLIDHF